MRNMCFGLKSIFHFTRTISRKPKIIIVISRKQIKKEKYKEMKKVTHSYTDATNTSHLR